MLSLHAAWEWYLHLAWHVAVLRYEPGKNR